MTQPLSVLITCAGTPSTPNLVSALRSNPDRSIKLVFCDVNPVPMYMKSERFYFVPSPKSNTFKRDIEGICREFNIDFILSSNETEMLKLLDSSVKSKMICSDPIPLHLCQEKANIFHKLNMFIPIPKFTVVHSLIEFSTACYKMKGLDLCMKPSLQKDSGGGRGFRIISDKVLLSDTILKRELFDYINYYTAKDFFSNVMDCPMLLMEYLPGTQFSVHCLALKGKLLVCLIYRVDASSNGYPVDVTIIKNDTIEAYCKKILEIIPLSYLVNIEFRTARDGTIKLVEINPRLAGSTAMASIIGVNLPYLALKLALDEDLGIVRIPFDKRIIRVWKETLLS